MVARVLWLRRQLRRHERWSQDELERHRRAELERLRRFARSRSAFYRSFHQGLDQAPLAALPPLTKADLMDNFDQISTDPTVRLAEVQTYLDGLTDNRRFRDRYWVSATSVSSGRRSVIASSAHEWAMTIASYGRAGGRVVGDQVWTDAQGEHGRGQLHHAVAPISPSRRHRPKPLHP